ncbi:hypothetical protein EH164_21270 [Kosakonia sp. CCTCC M2018092]|nr:hypothetical protein EH164_21270 [Kosakonia sp. CCTCC M2018092]
MPDGGASALSGLRVCACRPGKRSAPGDPCRMAAQAPYPAYGSVLVGRASEAPPAIRAGWRRKRLIRPT